jgi:quercetin dioxygenase-like cupin family protein
MPTDAVGHLFQASGAGTKVDVAGAEHTIVLAASQTGGAFSIDVISLSPGWAGPPAHVHQSHEETFIVLAGHVAYQLGDERIVGAAGSTLYVPRGVRHAFSNPHGEPARLLNVFTPAGYEDFFGELAALFARAQGQPNLADIGALFAKYDTVM